MDEIFDLAAIVVVLAAVLGYLNHLFLRLPQTIGLVVIAMAISLVVLGIDYLAPELGLGTAVRRFVDSIEFSETLMQGLLSFLLFAGALHVDLSALVRKSGAILAIAFLGTLLSTFLIGGAVWLAGEALGLGLALIYCLVFGALIAPTDPVAVLGILKRLKPRSPVKACSTTASPSSSFRCWRVLRPVAEATAR